MATDTGRQLWRRLATVGLLAALFLPVLRDQDGIPLSTYPMYATPRSGDVAFVVPYGVAADGTSEVLPRRTTTATADPLVAESTLSDEVAAGRADRLCRTIAGRVDDGGVVEVEVRLERHDVLGFATSERSLRSSDVVARCPVP